MALVVEVLGDLGERAAGGLELEHRRDQVGVGVAGLPLAGRRGGLRALAPGVVVEVAALGQRGAQLAGGRLDDLGRDAVGVQGPGPLRHPAAGLVGGQGVPGPLADAAALVGGDRDQDVDRQLVGVGVVAGDELDPLLLEVGHHRDRADQAVDLGDDQSGAGVVGVGGGGGSWGRPLTSSCMPDSTST